MIIYTYITRNQIIVMPSFKKKNNCYALAFGWLLVGGCWCWEMGFITEMNLGLIETIRTSVLV